VHATVGILAPMLRIRGSLSQTYDNEDVTPRTQGPEPSAARLAPRGVSAGVVDSLGRGFVLNPISELNALLDRFAAI